MSDHLFDRWNPGDLIEAKRLQEVQDRLQELDHKILEVGHVGTTIEWVRLVQWVGPASNFANRNATLQYLNPDTNKFQDTSPAQTVTVVTDPLAQLAYPTNAIIPVLAHWSGLYVPLSSNSLIFPVTLSGSLASGASTTVDLGGGNTVSATNSSGQTLSAGPAIAMQSLPSGTWLLTGAGNPADPTSNIQHAVAAADANPGSAGNVTLPDASVVSSTNWGGIKSFNAENVTVYKDGGAWYGLPAGTEIYSMT